MRLALVIKSAYAENTVVVRRDAFLDNAALLRERCSAEDACFEIVELEATRDLPEILEELLNKRGGLVESLLVYFTGYIAVKADRGPALLLDGSRLRAFPLSRLRASLEQGAQQALVVVDGLAVVDAEQSPAIVAQSVGEAICSPNGSVAALIGIEHASPAPRRGPHRFTDLLVLALDHLATKSRGGVVTDNAVYQCMQSDAISFSDIAGVVHRCVAFDFVLLAGTSHDTPLGHPTVHERATQRVPVFTGQQAALRTPGPPPATTESPRADGTPPATEAAVEDGPTISAIPAGDALQGNQSNEIAEGEPPPRSTAEAHASQRPPAMGDPKVQSSVGKTGERRVPTLADTPRARAASQRDWISEAAYFPSAPPPPVTPVVRAPTPSRPLQRTLPGVVQASPTTLPPPEAELSSPRPPDAGEPEPRDSGSRPFESAALIAEPNSLFPNPEAVADKADSLRPTAPDALRRGLESLRPGPDSLPFGRESLRPNPEAEPIESDIEPASSDSEREDSGVERYVSDADPDDSGVERYVSDADPDDSEVEPSDPDAERLASAPERADPEAEEPDSVISLYENLLEQLEETKDPRLAEVQSKLGDALRDAQRNAEALFAYERALDIDPQQSEAFEGACAIYREGRDFAGLVSTIHRKIETCEEQDDRLYLLDEIIDIWLSDVGDVPRAIDALEERLKETPDDVDALRQLIEAEDRIGDLLGRIDSRERLAKSRDADPGLRAAAWVEAATLAHDEFNDLARTFLMLESAVESGVYLPHTLNRAEALLGKSERWLEVIELYELALETAVSEPEAIHLATRLVRLITERSCQDALKPDTLSAIVRLAQRDAYLAELTVELVESMTQGAETLELLQRIRTGQPQYAALLHRLVELTHEEHTDVAINIASVLTTLGQATDSEQDLARQLSTDTLPTPSRSLDAADYESLLYPNSLDRDMTAGLARLERALYSALAFEKSKTIAVPKDAPIIDPETSTITLARSMLWTSRLLSVKAPELILLSDTPTLFRFVPQPQPRLLASRSLGSGFSLPELVYLVSRQSALELPGMIAREYCDAPHSLASLFFTLAVVADRGKQGIKSLADPEQKLGKRLLAQLEADPSLEEEIERVIGTESLSMPVCEQRATDWLKAVDHLRLRAALLACGTPSIAIELNRRYPLESLWTDSEQLDLLAAYAGSPEHCELRSRLAIATELLSNPPS
jgi:tetratricopeptide (TPR) repeat protein